jgi:hypothetical protein
MALLVDPPQRDGAAGRPAADTPDTVATLPLTVLAEPESQATDVAQPSVTEPPATGPRLAEPPITGGRVEALMGRLIAVLSHSPLARPLPAVILSVLGICGVAINGLCATAPQPSVATPPVLLPLTRVAENLGARHLNDVLANVIMYVSIGLCCLGLAMMLWANSRGWSPSPRRVFLAAVAAVSVLVCITPVGSGDIASYAVYGRIAALGYNPYTFKPNWLPGGTNNPYTMIVGIKWQGTPSVYGPVATWMQQFAAEIGGARPWLTIWVLMVMGGAAFLATGYVLLRTAENPVRAVLLWVANPLLIVELVMGGHLDTFLALAAIAAILTARRCTRPWHDLLVGLLVGLTAGLKINAAFVAVAIAIPLIHDRAWARLARTAAMAALTTFCLYAFSYGLSVLGPLRQVAAGRGDRAALLRHPRGTDPDHRDRVRLAAADAAARLVPLQPAVARRADGGGRHLRAHVRVDGRHAVAAALVLLGRLGRSLAAAAQLAHPLADHCHRDTSADALQWWSPH